MANEKRMIDANDIKYHKRTTCGGHGLYYDETIAYKEDIDSLPTVDAVEVKHGWWIELPSMEPDYKCSECGRSYAWWEPSEAHYCPNCGAKMDGDGNG